MHQEKSLQLRVLGEEESRQIHQAALQILREIGMNIQDKDTREMLKDRGCRESDDGYLLFDEGLVHQALSTVPSRMILYDRNGEVAVDTNDVVPHFGPGVNCVDVLDYKTGKHRPCLLEDISKTARVCDRLAHIDMVSSLGSPSDVPPHEEAIATVRAMVEQTRKPVAFTGHNEIEASKIWAYLAEVAGSWDSLTAKPFALELSGPTSPLKLGDEACRRLRHAARKCLPVVCYPGIIPGVAGPITLAGTLAQSSAEILAGIVVHQLEGPGAPVISGSALLPMDMRTGNLAYGSPDYSLACLAAVDYFNDRGVPAWIGAGCSDAHTVDAQAAAEAGMNMLAAVLSGTSFVHNLGYLSSGKTGSLEMLVLSDELAGMACRIAVGTTVNEDTLGVDVIRRAAKTGLYLHDEHTVKHVRTEMWLPALFQRTSLYSWRKSESKKMGERIREKLMVLLDERLE